MAKCLTIDDLQMACWLWLAVAGRLLLSLKGFKRWLLGSIRERLKLALSVWLARVSYSK